MKILKAKIKISSKFYEMGLNQKGRPVWLSITGFNPVGERNYKINAVKSITGGFAEFKEIWISRDEITMKQIDDGQLMLELFSEAEFKKQKYNPKYYNKKRFEITTKNQIQYVHAPDIESANHIACELGLAGFKIKQVRRLGRTEIDE